MSKKRGNKKEQNVDDGFSESQSITSEKDNSTSKPAKSKSSKKGKKSKKDNNWSDDEGVDDGKFHNLWENVF